MGTPAFSAVKMKMRGRAVNYFENAIIGSEGRVEAGEQKISVPIVRALVLSPRLSMVSGDGPTKTMPASSTRRAKLAFSDRKP